MLANVHAFTSITANYLPKARMLAESVKRTDPNVKFHLLLADDLPADFDLSQEAFDSVIVAEQLPIEDIQGWLFSHTVVELCTAVKGEAVEYIFNNLGADKVFYFDPDMVVFSRLDELQAELDNHSILLTPHQTEPEVSTDAILDNEISSLKFGVFNLGFVGVRNDEQGRKFSKWWSKRLLQFCHDDHARGLFTDQKWVNLAPCFFENIKVLRSPGFNVATWNITTRKATGSCPDNVLINGEPLGFYHFSGFDSGAQEVMLKKYGKGSQVLFELRDWYIRGCQERGQSELGKLPSKYATYDDGSPIATAERWKYRERLDLQRAFPDPFSTGQKSYRQWYRDNVNDADEPQAPSEYRYRTLSVDATVSFADVLADMARYFDDVAGGEKGNTLLRRIVLRLLSLVFRLGVRILR